MLDDTDRRILRQFQADPTASAAQLAERAGLTQATCWRRIERMQAQGIIRGTRAVIDWRALGYEVEVSLRVTLDKTQPRAFEDFAAEARKIPEVLEIQTFLGQVDARLGLVARDMTHYQQIYRTRILPLPHITDLDALMHIARIKHDESVPL
ncbi:Lrp/AsnC family transcriptional regulator [Pseudooceanicola sediminis]|uniref:Lrp/AsnC family transcriptional regulator n=1 Tax=Pseudooceanicola sediminis TaxID=2211117 RepID=A0A399IX83_9RHOB|nr:Lrp/AsnC family transcriptional regulator [Pseudooceanicola sediminis]KAA2313117.1 Lrp/AsnC family transcriptional regulator [Puniceibacterium sp. HSS470]RII37765.1 Lrp/AsnC family transcriptional regulator [Pseudooceanicola sediminis]|tara:strand:+ start:58712 stop:59167 length:456 start_codon:yes stop_codon:yes gene_type:complete